MATKNLVDAAMNVYIMHGYKDQKWTSDKTSPGYTVYCRCGKEFYIGEINTASLPNRPVRMDALEIASLERAWTTDETQEYKKLVNEHEAMRKQLLETNADLTYRKLHQPVIQHVRDCFKMVLELAVS